ncbi:MAG: L,D-transpeptidase family protein [Candidatus Andersenbacteria bacterium]
MKNNPRLKVAASILALLTILVGSGLVYVGLQQNGTPLPTTSVGTVTTTQVAKSAPVETNPGNAAVTQTNQNGAQPASTVAVSQIADEMKVLPAVTTIGAASTLSLRALLGEGLQLATPNHTYAVSAGELGSWINPDGLTWNDAMIQKKIRGIAREQDRAAMPTKVIGNTDEIVEQGTTGLKVDQDAAYEIVVKALLTGLTNRNLTIPTAITQPERVAVSSSAAPTITTGKQIVVVLAEQRLYAWNNGHLDKSYLISSGLTGPTPLGDFAIQTRYPVGCMSGPGYNLCNIHWIQYFTSAGHSFHEKWWNEIYGRPSSHGCINMTYEASHWLWDWATYGTPVHIVN